MVLTAATYVHYNLSSDKREEHVPGDISQLSVLERGRARSARPARLAEGRNGCGGMSVFLSTAELPCRPRAIACTSSFETIRRVVYVLTRIAG